MSFFFWINKSEKKVLFLTIELKVQYKKNECVSFEKFKYAKTDFVLFSVNE